MNRTHSPLPRTQSGFTLVEALITFLILAIGLLGLAGLQTKGLSFDKAAYQRTQAALLASDIIDRMRANITATRASDYKIAAGATVTSPPDCVGAACTTTTLSQFDLDQWKDTLAQLLPAGDGAIDIVAVAAVAPAVNATITVYWDELRSGKTGKNCPSGKRASDNDLMCFQLQVTL